MPAIIARRRVPSGFPGVVISAGLARRLQLDATPGAALFRDPGESTSPAVRSALRETQNTTLGGLT